jgi:hypothetical protein
MSPETTSGRSSPSVWAVVTIRVSGCAQGAAGGEQLLVHLELADQDRQDRSDAQVERAVHVPDERTEGVGLLGQRGAGLVARAGQDVEGDLPPAGSGGRGSAGRGWRCPPRPAGRSRPGGVGALLDDGVAGCGQVCRSE